MTTSLIKSLGLNLFLTFIFEKITDAKTWLCFSSTCKRARIIGKSLLTWKWYYGCFICAKMPSGKDYFTNAALAMYDFSLSRDRYEQFRTFLDIKVWKDNYDSNVKFINNRFSIHIHYDLESPWVKLPEGKNDDIVVIEPKTIRKQIISEIIGTPFIKVRINAKRVIEHRLSITGIYQERIIQQKKGQIRIVRYDEVDNLDYRRL